MSVYKKLQEARIKLQNTALKKTGHKIQTPYRFWHLLEHNKLDHL
mgnify:CR=1 FL=1